MWLKMIPTGLGMTTQTKLRDQTGTAHTLFFALHNAGQDSLMLETGEVFENPRYTYIHRNKKKIFARLDVRPASEGRDPAYTNRMSYFEEEKGNDFDDYGRPSYIYFEVSIPASDYSLLLNNVRGGMMPSAVTVRFPDDKGSPIEFGPAPDGSEIVWRNAVNQNRHVAVESIEFHYRLIGTDGYDDEDKAPPTAQASIDAASVAVAAKLADLEKAFVKGSSLIVTAIIIACAVLYFARH